MSEVTRHFTATTFLVCNGKVLLHRHPKQGLWLPPGGHIERDELPHVAAIREVEEETGLQVRLHSEEEAARMSREMACPVVPQPAFILVEDINPFHQHVDLTYFALVDAGAVHGTGSPSVWERQGFMWLTPADLEVPGVPENVKAGARRAIAFFEPRARGR